jgi:MFS family permease
MTETTKPGERWLGPGVAGIGTASFLADVGHEIPTALLPNLLTTTLGAPAAALGLIEGLSDGLAGAARLAGGVIADDSQRRRTVAVGGYTTTAVLSSLIGAATAVWQVAVLRAGAWAARGLRVPARNALLADIVPAAVYGRAYGFERAMDNLGAIVGPCSPWPWSAWSVPARPSPCRSSRACWPPWPSCMRSATPPEPNSGSDNRCASGCGRCWPAGWAGSWLGVGLRVRQRGRHPAHPARQRAARPRPQPGPGHPARPRPVRATDFEVLIAGGCLALLRGGLDRRRGLPRAYELLGICAVLVVAMLTVTAIAGGTAGHATRRLTLAG